MKVSRLLIALVCLIGVAAYADDEQEKEKERTEIRQMSQDTLARLYKAQPSAKAAVEKPTVTPFSATQESRFFLVALAKARAWPSKTGTKQKPS